jgi:ubiquinone/menaquinone biosynthesis C-methylase UbiE
MAVIPFYGTDHPELFATERAAMDRPGLVIDRLNDMLPRGTVVDIGAGDGFTAERLATPNRTIIAVEPARGMVDRIRPLTWVRADAEALPFRDGSVDGAYATWAYFFSRGFDPTPGIAELHRTVRRGGPLVVVENLGEDEFCSLAPSDISAVPAFWTKQGFTLEVIETEFSFETAQDALQLLTFYFGNVGPAPPTRLTYRVGLFIGESRGPS